MLLLKAGQPTAGQPPWVLKGMMVFPLRSWDVRNEHTTGGMVSPQIPAFDGQAARQ